MGCVSAVNNNNAKECDDDSFTFDNNDDYCFCGDATKVIPVHSDFPDECRDRCSFEGKGCIIGVQNNNVKSCDQKVDFDQNDDYCFCGEDSERVDISTYWQGPCLFQV